MKTPVRISNIKAPKVDDDALAVLLQRPPKNEFYEATLTDWQRLRDDVLQAWIADYPGTRPRAWWTWEAPEPRRKQVAGDVGDLYNALDHEVNYRYNYGVPAKYWYLAVKPDSLPRFESQASYLQRLDLFLPGERRRLTKADFMPEVVR